MANSPARMAVDVGSVIADTYTIEGLLGRGGMGAVFLASHKRLAGKRVAIKILHTEIEDVEVVARFKREAEIAAKLNHPNIVGVIDYNVAPDGTPYLVLDYLEGETLAQRIAAGPMAIDQVMSIMRQVGSALAAAHRAGIVHRDLKPQNIFLVPTEVDGRMVEIAKVLDFGISKIRGSQTVKTQDSTLLGTPQYMAPEQATGQHANVDERTDVFALGAIVYEMLSGRPAFSGASIPEVVFKVVYDHPPPLEQLVAGVPPSVLAAVSSAMAKPQDERFATAAAFVEALTGQPITLNRGNAIAPAGPGAESPSGRRVMTNEAFDHTMGPGVASPIATGSPPRTAVGMLATASPATARGVAPPSAPMVPAAPTVDLGGRGTVAPRKRSKGLLAAIVLGVAAAGGAAAYVATQRGDGAEPAKVATTTPAATPSSGTGGTTGAGGTSSATAASGSAAASNVAASATTAGSNAAATTASATETTGSGSGTTPAAGSAAVGSASTDTATTGPATTRPAHGSAADPRTSGTVTTRPDPRPRKPPRSPEPRPDPGVRPEDGDDSDASGVIKTLKEAAAALDRGDYNLAERLANTVINSPAPPRQRATARLIHGQVQCIARNDQEAAQIDLRALEGFRGMRTRLLNVCRKRGVINTP